MYTTAAFSISKTPFTSPTNDEKNPFTISTLAFPIPPTVVLKYMIVFTQTGTNIHLMKF